MGRVYAKCNLHAFSDNKVALFGVFDNKDTLLYNLDIIYPPIVYRWIVPRPEELRNNHFVAKCNARAPESIINLILEVIRTHIKEYSRGR